MRALLSHKFGLFEGHLVIIWPIATNSVSQSWSLWRKFGHHLTLCVQFCFTNLDSLKDISSSFHPMQTLLSDKFGLFEGHLVIISPFPTNSVSQICSLSKTFRHHLTLSEHFYFITLVTLKDIWSSFDPLLPILFQKVGLFEGHLVIIWPYASNSVSQIWTLWRIFRHHLTLCEQFYLINLVSLKDIWSSFHPLQPIPFHKVGLFEGHLVIIWPFATNFVSQVCSLWKKFFIIWPFKNSSTS